MAEQEQHINRLAQLGRAETTDAPKTPLPNQAKILRNIGFYSHTEHDYPPLVQQFQTHQYPTVAAY